MSESDHWFKIDEDSVLRIIKEREVATSEDIIRELTETNDFNEEINIFLNFLKGIGKIEYKQNQGWKIK